MLKTGKEVGLAFPKDKDPLLIFKQDISHYVLLNSRDHNHIIV